MQILEERESSEGKPLFMYVAHQSVHAEIVHPPYGESSRVVEVPFSPSFWGGYTFWIYLDCVCVCIYIY